MSDNKTPDAEPEKPDIWLACAEANKDDLRKCAVYLEGGWKCDEDWHYVPVERIAELEAMTSVRRIAELNAKVAKLEAERDALKAENERLKTD